MFKIPFPVCDWPFILLLYFFVCAKAFKFHVVIYVDLSFIVLIWKGMLKIFLSQGYINSNTLSFTV